ncbi:MAG: hypothetical protein ACOYUK_05550 [Patescibacteria group bacterium]
MTNNRRANNYWTPADHSVVSAAQSFSELLPTALTIIRRMPQPVAMVSGPMSTGGAGSLEKNVSRFAAAIHNLNEAGITTFDQLPFQKSMIRLLQQHHHATSYYMPLLEDFYLPVFQSGLIARVYFLPDWHTSFGARWEHDQCEKLGIPQIPFPDALLP